MEKKTITKESYILPKYKIPAHPGLQILMAIQDLEIMEQDERYVIDMECWHWFYDNKCHVCLAGCVLGNRIKPSVNYIIRSDNNGLGKKFNKIMRFLDCIRIGEPYYANHYVPKKWKLNNKNHIYILLLNHILMILLNLKKILKI